MRTYRLPIHHSRRRRTSQVLWQRRPGQWHMRPPKFYPFPLFEELPRAMQLDIACRARIRYLRVLVAAPAPDPRRGRTATFPKTPGVKPRTNPPPVRRLAPSPWPSAPRTSLSYDYLRLLPSPPGAHRLDPHKSYPVPRFHVVQRAVVL
jgi:hypothetical protein